MPRSARLLVALLLVAVSLAGAGCERRGAKESGPGGEDTTTHVGPQRQQVNGHDYLSPCQLLTRDDVTNIYGQPPADAPVQEQFLDFTVPYKNVVPNTALQDQLPLMCIYRYGGHEQVQLRVREFAVPSNAVTWVDNAYGNLQMYPVAQANREHQTPTLRRLLRDFHSSREAINNGSGEATAPQLDGKRFPNQVAGTPIEIGLVHDNSIIIASHIPRQGVGRSLSPGQLGRELRLLSEALDAVETHLDNAELSQQPAPLQAVPGTRIGNLLPLDACQVLSKKTFQSITGMEQTGPVFRVGVAAEPGRQSPPMQCDRQMDNNAHPRRQLSEAESYYGRLGKIQVSLNLFPQESEVEATQVLTKLRRKRPEVSSNAPSAFILRKGRGTGVILFREGPYVAQVALMAKRGDSSPLHRGKITKAALVDAANKVDNQLLDSLAAAMPKKRTTWHDPSWK